MIQPRRMIAQATTCPSDLNFARWDLLPVVCHGDRVWQRPEGGKVALPRTVRAVRLGAGDLGVLMNICPKCNEFVLDLDAKYHRCKLQWRVWPDGDDEPSAVTIRAVDAEEAAEIWAARNDEESEITDRWEDEGLTTTVYVRALEGGPERQFEVRGEMAPTYHAQEVST